MKGGRLIYNVIKIDRYREYENKILNLRFEKRVFRKTIDNKIEEYYFIVLNNKFKNKYKILGYSKFLNYYLINKSSNTINSYCKIIVQFLNYIFLDNYKKYKITNINDLKFDHANDFLRDISNGKIGRKAKSKICIIKYENKIKHFYKFLLLEIKGMKYITFKELEKYNFKVVYPKSITNKRIKSISDFLFKEIIKTTQIYYPNLTLAICFQAFGGLRKGEVCNITKDKIHLKRIGQDYQWVTIDLREETKMRDDLRVVGRIKKKRVQPIHPIFMKVFQEVYSNHMKLISHSNNKYGAIFLNSNDESMTELSYNQKFKKIIELTIKRLCNSEFIDKKHKNSYQYGMKKTKGIFEVLSEVNMLNSGNINTHVLRHYFTQFLMSLKNKSPHEIAYWRGDSSLESAISYLTGSPIVIDNIKEVQEEIFSLIVGENDER